LKLNLLNLLIIQFFLLNLSNSHPRFTLLEMCHFAQAANYKIGFAVTSLGHFGDTPCVQPFTSFPCTYRVAKIITPNGILVADLILDGPECKKL
jgi:hypothetical protein